MTTLTSNQSRMAGLDLDRSQGPQYSNLRLWRLTEAMGSVPKWQTCVETYQPDNQE